jgi:Tfp pilus assembly protein PilN
MIRVNLIEVKSVRRRKRTSSGGGNTSLLLLGIIVLEFAGLFYWYSQVQDVFDQESQAVGLLFQEKQDLENIQTELSKLNKLRNEVNDRSDVFKKLENGKVGPMNMLLYLSYALRRVDMGSMSTAEQDVLNKHWKSKRVQGGMEQRWNPERVWLTSVAEEKGLMSIDGEAKDHEDVALFIKRLRSSIYFDGLDLVTQERKYHEQLDQSYVSFKLECELNYSPTGYPSLEDVGSKGH